MASHRYSKEELLNAIETSTSIRQVLIKLKLAPYGGSYTTIHRAIKKFNLDTSHFTGQGHLKGKKIGPKKSIHEYLSNKIQITSYKLKSRLIKEGLLEHKCYNCELKEWLGKPIPIELEHKDGNHNNNLFDNLTILCPNCHSLTPTYRGKNKRKNI